RRNARGQMVTVSEAVVAVRIGAERIMNVADSFYGGSDRDHGPVHALSAALRHDLGRYADHIADLRLVDFKVRITGSGTEAVTRVQIDSEDGQGRRWSTVGVSPNLVDASFEALVDAINWKLIRDGVEAA